MCVYTFVVGDSNIVAYLYLMCPVVEIHFVIAHLDAISSGLWNRRHSMPPEMEFDWQTNSDVGSALNTQYDLPNGSLPIGIDFPHVNADFRVMLARRNVRRSARSLSFLLRCAAIAHTSWAVTEPETTDMLDSCRNLSSD